MKSFHALVPFFLSAAVLVAAACPAVSQVPPGEHNSHHPQQSSPTADSAATDTSSGRGMPGGKADGTNSGMGGMGEMMQDMGKPPGKELYPSLMQLPDLSPERRAKISQLANERIDRGNTLLSLGLQKLRDAAGSQYFAGIQEANEQIRAGQALVQSGLAAQQALAENKNPREIALKWFRQEMNLTPYQEVEPPHGFFGLSWFHYLTMLVFAAFAVAMIWMYFHKMKRANALIEKLAGKSPEKIPAPGEAKPVAPPPAKGEPAPNAEPAKGEPVTAKGTPPLVGPGLAPSKPNSWTGTLLVTEIFDETPNVKTFRLTDPAGGKLPFNFLPGQFITITINPKGVPVKRSYTIASSPTHRDYCEITVKHEEKGTVSHYLHTEVHIGELLQFTAPSGKFTFTEAHAESAVFIAGGVGVTPMMSAIRYLTDRSWKGEIYFFFTCKNESSIIFREEILYLQKRYPNLHVWFLLEEPVSNPTDSFIKGRITKEILAERVPDIITRMIHICGPPPMMNAVKEMLDELKVPKEMVMTEVFAGPPPKPKTVSPTPEEKGKPPVDEEVAKPFTSEEAGKTGVVTFAKSNKTAVLTPDKSILEASEEVGVNIDYSCRVGTCGICKIKLNSGKVTMAVEDALTEDDKTQNMILACQAKATEDVSVDA
ncbi:FAD-binding oxidoreductase [Pontibacter sp. SGAir0037]|uniref:FAD-binding oxidoreductase n=1 Tax=Pontibacter sp. SGAir0037 TaxID=2571030 RepID=UPI0010CCEF3B|nr:FAD-binding oxidoreductase [Pontibacter sp. SGAir0037]QCR25320.1 oxidoreductase [Pontibacter sp. SGAir0037]